VESTENKGSSLEKANNTSTKIKNKIMVTGKDRVITLIRGTTASTYQKKKMCHITTKMKRVGISTGIKSSRISSRMNSTATQTSSTNRRTTMARRDPHTKIQAKLFTLEASKPTTALTKVT
jgi:hypothetical protein